MIITVTVAGDTPVLTMTALIRRDNGETPEGLTLPDISTAVGTHWTSSGTTWSYESTDPNGDTELRYTYKVTWPDGSTFTSSEIAAPDKQSGYWTNQIAVERKFGVLNMAADANLSNTGAGVAAVWIDALAEVDAVFNREIAAYGSPDLSLDDASIRFLARNWCRVLLYSSRGWTDEKIAFKDLEDKTWARFLAILINPAKGSEETDVTAPVALRQTMNADGRTISGTPVGYAPYWDQGYGWRW